jgi:hypothetical protein
LFLGVAASYAKEKLSGRLFTEREIKKLVPLGIIAEIPSIETPQEQAAHRRQGWIVGFAATALTGVILLGSAISYLYG